MSNEPDRFGGLLGTSAAMRELFALLERLAPSDVPVLLEGETGTGKELAAQAIHAASSRKSGPFVVCDLAGATRSLFESELFGHLRGAFTGADRDRAGAFAQAHGGTLFIDEVGELALDAQPRLLRALEQRQVKPLGASSYRDLDVRVIAATHRDLASEIQAGRFRADLFHRLAVVRVPLPPLRDRKEDIALLVTQFLAGSAIEVPSETLERLREHPWPGNVRELRNALDRARSLIGPTQVLVPSLLGLPKTREFHPAPDGYRRAKQELIAQWEREYLRDLLDRSEGNVAQAARTGGMDRVHLHRLLKKHGLASHRKRSA